jgi:small-conductance mechanosensitive channel
VSEILAGYSDILSKVVASLIIVSFTFLLNRLIGRLLQLRVNIPTHVYTLRMLVRNTLLILSGLLVLATWMGFGSNFTAAIGIFGAGIAFASQEVVGSFAGYLNIVTGNIFYIGDRVRIGDVVGDVVDIGMLRTTVMEIEAWVRADQYTGRMVTVANRAIFSGPVFNYTQDWPYLWDEITLPITYDSDWRLAREILLDHGREYTSEFETRARSGINELIRRYPIQEMGLNVEPTLYVIMTDNWIELTLRYVVDPHERRAVASNLHSDILQHFESEEEITIASATFDIVGFPPLEGDVRVSGEAQPSAEE